MVDLRDIAAQVVENCTLMDAQHAGGFSICGLALRLRDLYKWEQGLDPWVEGESGEARAVKDLLADTHEAGTLRYIIDGERHASLGFYTAFLDGLRKALFPEMAEAFAGFQESGDWSGIDRALRAVRARASHHAAVITEAYERGLARGDLPRAEAEIEERLLAPLGLPGKEEG